MPKVLKFNLQETLMFICMQKNQLHLTFFEICSEKHCNLAISGTLGMIDHSHQKS